MGWEVFLLNRGTEAANLRKRAVIIFNAISTEFELQIEYPEFDALRDKIIAALADAKKEFYLISLYWVFLRRLYGVL